MLRYTAMHLNTSHVLIYLTNEELKKQILKNLNTSHVLIYLKS